MADLFVEVFPLEPDATPPLFAYQLLLTGEPSPAMVDRLGRRVARHLRRSFPGAWLWLEGDIITDEERGGAELMINLDLLKGSDPDRYAALDGIEPASVSTQMQAEFMLRTRLRDLGDTMQDALDRQQARIRNATVEREHRLQAWEVNGEPAASISIASRLIYDQTVQQYAGTEHDLGVLGDKLNGLWASDPAKGRRGEITGIVGRMGDHRARLLDLPPQHMAIDDLQAALDGELVISVRIGDEDYEYLAQSLWLIVRLPHLPRFEINPVQALQTLQMQPRTRALLVKSVSDIGKEAAVLGNGYNSRTHPQLFFNADFEMNLRYGGGRVRPYNNDKLPYDFAELGEYHLREDFTVQPVRVCVVNTLALKLEDFVEALQRQLKRNFNFAIDVIRERRVRVVSRSNLESAVRVVEKENPDIILAFFPDDLDAGDDDDSNTDATADYIKSLTLGRGLPTHVIYQSTLDDPDAMPGIIMSILGKTGSVPYVLTEPLEHVDFVVGLDIVREYFKTTGETCLTAIARFYQSDGAFIRYTVRDLSQTETALPYVLMRDLFPQKEFANKRVLIHHDGPFAVDLLQALAGWGQAIKAAFCPVEINRLGAPRIYALEGGIVKPPWGSAFKLSDREALLVSFVAKEDITPQPLRVRLPAHPLLPPPVAIEGVLRSILVWTLLAYGAERLPKLPVTTMNAEQLAYWLRRGGRFERETGVVPFWL